MKCLALSGFLLAICLLLSACAPSLTPLYRDYRAPERDSTSLDAHITAALADAGWDTVATSVPNAVATEERVLSNWGLYKVTASLEVAPLGNDYVRVYVHPYRKYVVGGRGKIPYLTRRIQAKFVPVLNEAFEAHGMAVAGTPFERDDTRIR